VRVPLLVILVISLDLPTAFDLFNCLYGLLDIFEDDLTRASPQV
jgi:hypothetical protein